MTDDDFGAAILPDDAPENVFRNGFVGVNLRSGIVVFVQPAFGGPVKDAWDAGRPFVDALDIYGDPVRFKLAEVDCVAVRTRMGLLAVSGYGEWRQQRERERKPFDA